MNFRFILKSDKDEHITIDIIWYDIDHTRNFWTVQYTIILSDVSWLEWNRIMKRSFYYNCYVAAVLKTLQLPVSCASDILVYSLDMF